MSNDIHDPRAGERPLTKAELAAYLRVSVRQVERLMATELIAFFRVGRSPRFTREAIASFERRNGFLAPPLSGKACTRSRGASSRFPFMQEPDREFVRLLPSIAEGS
jgi:excisionase family DNA binding protein